RVLGTTIRSTADKFGIQLKQIREWHSKKQELMLAQPHIKCLNSGPRSAYPELELELATWVKNLCNNLKPVSHSIIQTKAASLASLPQYTNQFPHISSFRWSNKWLDGFMHCYKFSNRHKTIVAQHLPTDLEAKQQEFLSLIQYCCIQHDYPLLLIGNMDETPLTFDMPNNVTVDTIGNKTVGIRTCRHEKSNFTIVLGCMVDGAKLPLIVIFKLKNIPRHKFLLGIIIRANEKE
ncbi:6488_t:CDS:1, partial [Scutellospora calospora]